MFCSYFQVFWTFGEFGDNRELCSKQQVCTVSTVVKENILKFCANPSFADFHGFSWSNVLLPYSHKVFLGKTRILWFNSVVSYFHLEAIRWNFLKVSWITEGIAHSKTWQIVQIVGQKTRTCRLLAGLANVDLSRTVKHFFFAERIEVWETTVRIGK